MLTYARSLFCVLAVLVAMPTFAEPASKIDEDSIAVAVVTSGNSTKLANTAFDELEAKHAAAVKAVAEYNQARKQFIVLRQAALESLSTVVSTAMAVLELHERETLPPEIVLGLPAPSPEPITPLPGE